MLDYLKSLFWPDEPTDADEIRRHETGPEKQARKLEMDEPMAGAGALLDSEDERSETEENLRRDTEERG